MKIAVVSDDQKTISSHFGRARGFVIFEVEGKEIKAQRISSQYLYRAGKRIRGCRT